MDETHHGDHLGRDDGGDDDDPIDLHIENGWQCKNVKVDSLKVVHNFYIVSSPAVFSGWQICIWLTSIAIQIFKYAANFGIAS